MEERNQWNKTAQWEQAIGILEEIVTKSELVATKKWGGPVYTWKGKNVVGIGGFKSYVGIWFYNGVFLKDDAKKLVSANEGVTKSLRQWRFTSEDEIKQNEKLILQYIVESIANEEAGKVLKPRKKETVISEFFQKALDSDVAFAKAFSAFTPGRQREFLEYVDSAKREETKVTRLNKIIPMVLDNVGLNDKYK